MDSLSKPSSASELVYLDGLREIGDVIISSDDGSAGVCGYVSDILHQTLTERKNDRLRFAARPLMHSAIEKA